MVFTTRLVERTKNTAEIEASIFGSTWALDFGYKNILHELDSQLVVYSILQKVSPQWSIITQLGRLQHFITEARNLKYIHVSREENFIGDSLSKHSYNTTTHQVYLNNHQLRR